VCMHACDPLIRRSQTTGSMVVELHPDDKIRIFVTAGSAPCLTPFKPFMPAAPFMDTSRGAAYYSKDSYWWRHEAYHINAMFRYDSIWPLMQERIKEQETQWAKGMPAYEWDCNEVSLVDSSHGAFVQSEQMEKAVFERMRGMKKQAFRMSHLFWRHMARRSGVPII
jgi:dipeptidase